MAGLSALWVACVAPGTFAAGPSADSRVSMVVPFEKYHLDNGLNVILSEDHTLPFVALDLAFAVGSRDDPPTMSGLAHLFEHIMFQGSAHVEPNQHFRYLERAGATAIDGRTSPDITVYRETVPSERLELALWLESDRLGFLLDRIDPERVALQKRVVQNEWREKVENAPYGFAARAMMRNAFPETHPYHRILESPVSGTEAITLEDIVRFAKTYYRPNNASLAITGDFNPVNVRAMVERYFGPIPPGPVPNRPLYPTPLPTSGVQIKMEASVELPKLLLAWPTPGVLRRGDADLDIIARILENALRSRLMIKRNIAHSVSAHQQSFQLASLFHVSVEISRNASLNEALMLIEESLEDLRNPANRWWSESYSTQQLTEIFDRTETLASRAEQLNFFNLITHDPGRLWLEVARYSSVRPESVRSAVRQYLPAAGMILTTIETNAAAPIAGRLVGGS